MSRSEVEEVGAKRATASLRGWSIAWSCSPSLLQLPLFQTLWLGTRVAVPTCERRRCGALAGDVRGAEPADGSVDGQPVPGRSVRVPCEWGEFASPTSLLLLQICTQALFSGAVGTVLCDVGSEWWRNVGDVRHVSDVARQHESAQHLHSAHRGALYAGENQPADELRKTRGKL